MRLMAINNEYAACHSPHTLTTPVYAGRVLYKNENRNKQPNDSPHKFRSRWKIEIIAWKPCKRRDAYGAYGEN